MLAEAHRVQVEEGACSPTEASVVWAVAHPAETDVLDRSCY